MLYSHKINHPQRSFTRRIPIRLKISSCSLPDGIRNSIIFLCVLFRLEIAYIDTGLAKEQENGVEDVKKAGRAAGLSEEAIEDTLESGGILAVPVECYAQSEASPALLETVSFSPGAEPMARMKASAAAFYEEAEARLKETIARQKRLEETITKELFPTEGEERNLAMEAMTINPDNPAQGWRAMKEEIEGQRSDVLAEAWDAIEKGLPKEKGQAGAAWYETWKKEHGRAPKEEELAAIAYALTVGDKNAPKVEGFNQGAEVAAIRAAAKENLDAIDKKRKALDAIKERMTELTGIEMRQTETLTGEGYRVYRHILSDLKSADNPKVTRAARISALLFARHADIYAAAMRKRGGEYAGYTAMDYYNKAFALDISGKAPEDGERLNQAAMRAGIDLNQEVPVLDITEQIPGKNLTKQDKKELLSYIRSLAEQKEHGLTADGLADIGIMPKNAKHIAYSSFFAPPMPMRIRAGAIQTIGDLIKNAVLVESIPNRKTEKKPHVRAYHRFYVPVRFVRGNDYQVETIRLVAEERDGEITINPTAVELYDVIIEEENRFPSGVKPLMDRSDSPLVITIRDLLRNVKDADGKPYLSDKEKAAISGTETENPSLYQEAHGYTQFLSNGQRLVTLMESADESTFLHELGHVFLDDLRRLSTFDEASQKELSTVDEWAAWHEGAAKEYQNTPWEKEFKAHEAAILAAKKSGDAKALEKALKVWRHERFARAFERYLKEGEAPARGLKQVFRKFAAFLRSIYQAFTSDGGRASMEVERVMDRMIATDEEIEDAAQDKRYRDFTKAGGEKLLRESDKATYQRWHEKAKAEAKERLRKMVTKKLERERKAKLSAEIESEEERFRTKLYEEPIYQAREAVKMAKDENAALLFYPTVEEYQSAAKRAPEMETLVKEHMEDYRRTREKALFENAITPDEVEKAMAGTEYHDRLLAYEAKAFAKQADALRRISGKAQAAMDEVEEKIEEMPEGGRASAEEAELTKEEVTARIKEAVQGMDEKDIPKILIQDAHRFDGLDEQALFAVALQEMKKLTAEKIADPLGHEIYFAPGETETLESYVLHLIAGRGKQVEDIRTKRVLGLSLAKETIAHPLAIIVQENSRLAYLALYTDGTNFQNSIIVGVEEGQEGRVVTSMLTADKKGDKKAAVREFKKRISGSKEVLYWEGQSGHSRPSSETWASTLNAKLHPSGNFSIAEDGGKSKEAGKSEKKTDAAKEKYSARDLYRAIHRLRSAHRWGAEELSAIDALGKAASKADLKAAWEKAKELLTTEHLAEQELKEALRGQSQLYRELARKEIANMTITEASAIMTFRRQEKESAARVERLVKAENWAAAEKTYTRLKTTPSTRCPAVSSGRRRLPGHR